MLKIVITIIWVVIWAVTAVLEAVLSLNDDEGESWGELLRGWSISGSSGFSKWFAPWPALFWGALSGHFFHLGLSEGLGSFVYGLGVLFGAAAIVWLIHLILRVWCDLAWARWFDRNPWFYLAVGYLLGSLIWPVYSELG